MGIKLFTCTSSSEPLGKKSTIIGTKHPWVYGIQVNSNEGPCYFLWGDN